MARSIDARTVKEIVRANALTKYARQWLVKNERWASEGNQFRLAPATDGCAPVGALGASVLVHSSGVNDERGGNVDDARGKDDAAFCLPQRCRDHSRRSHIEYVVRGELSPRVI